MIEGWHKQRFRITVAGVVLLIAVWLLGSYLPVERELDRNRNLLVEMKTKIAGVAERLGYANSAAKGARTARLQWREATRDLVEPDDAEQLLHRVRNLAQDAGLTVLDSRFDFMPLLERIGGPEPAEPIGRLGIRADGRGRYSAVGRFLDDLRCDAVVADIREVNLYHRPAIDPEIYFTVHLDVFILWRSRDRA